MPKSSIQHSLGVPSTITPEEDQLQRINQRWKQFYEDKKEFLLHFAYEDEDLATEGLLAVQETPHCPESWLVRRAKLTIMTARRLSEYGFWLSFNNDQRNDEDFFNDALQYEAMTPLQQEPEKQFIDQAQFHKMWDALSDMEREFLLILREEYIQQTRHRWYGGVYAHTQPQRPNPKTRFREEVSHSITDYYNSFANIRYHFYMNFGTDEEVEREKEWYASYSGPNGRLHATRDGRYHRDPQIHSGSGKDHQMLGKESAS